MFKHAFAVALFACATLIGSSQSAWAQMPQTDVDLIAQMEDASTDDVLEALAVFYDLHVSDLDVQLKHEENTGAFFGIRNAQRDGGDVKAAETHARDTRRAWDGVREQNVALRQELNMITGIDFPDSFAMAPDAPFEKPAAPEGAPADLKAERNAAWARVVETRDAWAETRMKLLEAQDRYDEHRDVAIGDAMRDMTRAEIAAVRAAADFRLIEAKIAAATGGDIAQVLSDL